MDKMVFVGKNYLEHAQELGDAVPDTPVIFLKPPSILRQVSQWHTTQELSLYDADVHYETEIVLQLKCGGYRISASQAGACIGAVTIGLDMTRRGLQTQLKKQGHPWTIGKVFPDAAVVGPMIPLTQFSDYLTTPFSFTLNGDVRQQSAGELMTFLPIALISYISEFFPLCEGDLIFTGTPAGVGPVNPGDKARLAWGESYWYDVAWTK
jgi:2-keto-4-pentenoate hydratase/2-oxohepta-3-ene-1,7-dioic acid hydratase in catechol pathway